MRIFQYGESALLIAISKRHSKCAMILIENGAYLSFEVMFYLAILFVLIFFGFYQKKRVCVKTILSNILHYVLNGGFNKVYIPYDDALLLALSSSIFQFQETALLLAIQRDLRDVIEVLLMKGASPNALTTVCFIISSLLEDM